MTVIFINNSATAGHQGHEFNFLQRGKSPGGVSVGVRPPGVQETCKQARMQGPLRSKIHGKTHPGHPPDKNSLYRALLHAGLNAPKDPTEAIEMYCGHMDHGVWGRLHPPSAEGRSFCLNCTHQ